MKSSPVTQKLLSLFLQRRFLASLMLITMTGFAIVMVYASSYHRNEFKAAAYSSIHNNSAGRKTTVRKMTGKHSSTHSSTSSFKITTIPTTRLLTSTSTTRLLKKTTTATAPAAAANVNKNRQLRPVTSSSVHTTATKPNSTRLFKMDDKLLQEYLQRLSGIKPRGRNYRNISCPLTLEDKLKNGNPCFDENCSSTFPVPAERLRMMLQSHDILSAQFAEVIDSLANESQRADFIFLTAASSNHYGETQATIKGLQEIIFPMLHKHFPGNTTRLVYFDLGLRKLQTDLLRKYGKCDVIAFPFDKLPPYFRKLSTCSWKPLLLKAYLKYSRLTVWMDSSTRIIETSSLAFLSVVQRALADGMVISRTHNMLARHVAQPMLNYFRLQACQLAPFFELAGGFIALKNDFFVEKVILDSWVACAFSPDCLCPGQDCQKLYNGCGDGSKVYTRCHRFDQSAIAVILVALFDWRSSLFVVDGPKGFSFNRGHKIEYLPSNL